MVMVKQLLRIKFILLAVFSLAMIFSPTLRTKMNLSQFQLKLTVTKIKRFFSPFSNQNIK